MRARMSALALLVASTALVAGCGAEPEHESKGAGGILYQRTVTLPDRTLTCMVLEDGSGGGLSCDWSGR